MNPTALYHTIVSSSRSYADHLLAIEAERWASGAAGSGSAADAGSRRLLGSRNGAYDGGVASLWRSVAAGSAARAPPSPGFHPRPPHTVRAVLPPTAFRPPAAGGLHGPGPPLPSRAQDSRPLARRRAWRWTLATWPCRRAPSQATTRGLTDRSRAWHCGVEGPRRHSGRPPRMLGCRVATRASRAPRRPRRPGSARRWWRPAGLAVWPGHLRGMRRPDGLARTVGPWPPRHATPAGVRATRRGGVEGRVSGRLATTWMTACRAGAAAVLVRPTLTPASASRGRRPRA
jgi:hypothetical protein